MFFKARVLVNNAPAVEFCDTNQEALTHKLLEVFSSAFDIQIVLKGWVAKREKRVNKKKK